MVPYRPWGHIDWLLGRLVDSPPWSLLGCCGTEERSIAVPCYMRRSRLEHASIVAIHDPEPLNPAAFKQRLQSHQAKLTGVGFDNREIHETKLLTGVDEITTYVTKLADLGATRLLLDITSLPKRWFFLMIQAAMLERRLEDVIVTYTSAVSYAEQLSENMEPLRVLPGFFAEDGRSSHDALIVGIGFEPLGLVSLLSDIGSKKIRLIFPFPPGPPGHRRNWMFVKQIEERTQSHEIDSDRVHIHMYDCSQVFDALCEMTESGRKTAAIAPYGPKTVSLAMCLYSIAVARAGLPMVPVYYAQPQRYTLDYTTGVRLRGNAPDTTGYCLRLKGREFYSI